MQNAHRGDETLGPVLDVRSEKDVLAAVARACAGMRYGSVEAVVHDGRIVQIVRTERIRVSEPSTRDPR